MCLSNFSPKSVVFSRMNREWLIMMRDGTIDHCLSGEDLQLVVERHMEREHSLLKPGGRKRVGLGSASSTTASADSTRLQQLDKDDEEYAESKFRSLC